MSDFLNQLGLNPTYFVQLIVFTAFYFFSVRVFFRPFQALFEARHKQTVSDKEAAEKMLVEAEAKLKQYQDQLDEARSKARAAYEAEIKKARDEESALIVKARSETKKTVQEALAQSEVERVKIRQAIQPELGGMAKKLSDLILAGRP